MGNGGPDRFFIFQGDSVLVPADCPDGDVVKGVSPETAFSAFDRGAFIPIPAPSGLFSSSGLLLSGDEAPPPSWKALPFRPLMSHINSLDGGLRGGEEFLRALHILRWRGESAFCGRCGSPNADHETELARLCPSCGGMEFPRISPAVIVVITDSRDRLLLAHNRKFLSGVYSLIAGFTEAGESLEDTVAREIREEAGLDVTDIRYIASQPWPFPDSLMIGFSAYCGAGEPRPDGVEISDVRWFSRDELPDIPRRGSLSRYLIDRWIKGGMP